MHININLRQVLCVWIAVAFLGNTFVLPQAHAQELNLPAAGTMVHLSPAFNPPVLKGIKVHPDNPVRFDFILDQGDEKLTGPTLKSESAKLIRYFLASMTIPENDLWVNLSPYEKDRIVPEAFGQTEMGRDLLAQDYILKQITASLIYPEDELGKKFWKRVYQEAAKTFGTTNVPINTFNKVWIVPEKAVVYENAKSGTAYVVESKLKVMLEEDYLALEKNAHGAGPAPAASIASQIVREIVIPELTKEINKGKNFAQLRQVYSSLILATWYKKKIKDSILSQVYQDKNNVNGLEYMSNGEMFGQEQQKNVSPESIYEQYLQAFKKGAYNYIKEEQDLMTSQVIPRKYFSGGVLAAIKSIDYAQASRLPAALSNADIVTVDLAMASWKPIDAVSNEGPPNSGGGFDGIQRFFDQRKIWMPEWAKHGLAIPEEGNGLHIVLVGPGFEARDLKVLLNNFPLAKRIDVLDINDFSEYVETIKQRMKGSSTQIEFTQGSISDRPGNNVIKNADLVLAFNVFDIQWFSPDGFQRIHDNVHGMLREGGALIINSGARYTTYPDTWIRQESFDKFKIGSFTFATKKKYNVQAGEGGQGTESSAQLAEEDRAMVNGAKEDWINHPLVKQFRNVPGINRVVSTLSSANKDGQLGTLEELAQAALLRQAGYKILGLDLNFNRRNGENAGEVDILAKKNGEYYFVEVKRKKASDSSGVIMKAVLRDSNAAHGKLEIFSELFKGLVGNDRIFVRRLYELIVYDEATALLKALKRPGYRPKVLFSITLLFDGKTEEDRDRYMENLVTNPMLYMDAEKSKIEPIVIAREYGQGGRIHRQMTVSGALQEKFFGDLGAQQDDLKALLQQSCLVYARMNTVNGSREERIVAVEIHDSDLNDISLRFLSGESLPSGNINSMTVYYLPATSLEVISNKDNGVGNSETGSSAQLAEGDKAMKSTGGIDLNPTDKILASRVRGNDIEGQVDEEGIQFKIDPAMLEQIRDAPGFVPVIINIQPMTDLKRFLGISH